MGDEHDGTECISNELMRWKARLASMSRRSSGGLWQGWCRRRGIDREFRRGLVAAIVSRAGFPNFLVSDEPEGQYREGRLT
jgi:hypothetical protein